jgi:hypothetical protein
MKSGSLGDVKETEGVKDPKSRFGTQGEGVAVSKSKNLSLPVEHSKRETYGWPSLAHLDGRTCSYCRMDTSPYAT